MPPQAAYEAALAATEAEIAESWAQIVSLVEQNDPTLFRCCKRPFCFCNEVRPLVFPEQALFD